MAVESGDSYSIGIAFTCHGVSCYGRELLEEAEEYLLKGVGFFKGRKKSCGIL